MVRGEAVDPMADHDAASVPEVKMQVKVELELPCTTWTVLAPELCTVTAPLLEFVMV